MDAAESAVRETLARARKIFTSGAVTTLAILKEADQDLSDELHRIVAKHGGPSGTFTEASAQLYRKQVQLVTGYLEKRLAGHTHTAAMKASKVALKDTVKIAKGLEKQFTGITRPLQLENQQMQDAALRGTGASLLRKHQSSFSRYGQAMVADFERVMRGAQLQGLTHEQIVSKLVESGKLGGHTAGTLHAGEPGYFPEPTSYVKRRYWAERIVRTELAYAANATSLQGMNVLRETEFPDMQKKILAVMDARTAPDSIAVHGQIRKLEEMFQDGAGRLYLHPPARPNDRETVIPWRPHWKENAATDPAPPAAQAQAVVDAQPSPLGATRKEELQSALQKAKAKVLAKKAGAEEAQAQAAALQKAQAATQQGQQALQHAVVADAAALQKAVTKGKPAVTPGAAYEAAKAKAAAYQAAQVEAAKLKAEQEAAARQAALQAQAKGVVELYQDPALYSQSSGKAFLDDLKALAKGQPKLFAEAYAHATGKPAAEALGKMSKPLQFGKVVKQMALKLQPGLDYPKPKPKKPVLTPDQELAAKKAALLAPNVDLKAAAAAFTDAEVHAVLKGNPLVLEGEVAEVLAMSPQGKGAYLHQVVSDWQKLQAEASVAKLEDVPSGDKHYVDVFQGGKKVAFFFQEGAGEELTWTVKPPDSIAASHPVTKFASKNDAAAYALEVGKQLAAAKAQVASTAAAEQLLAAKKVAAGHVAKAPVKPGEMAWSSKWRGAERKPSDVTSDPAKDLAKHLKADRNGHALALDEDAIENFDVSFTRETTEGPSGPLTETVVRFKVTAHRGPEVMARLARLGAKQVPFEYQALKDLESSELVKGGQQGRERAAGVDAYRKTKGKLEITMFQTRSTEETAAGHNVVEMRFRGEVKDAMKQAREGFEALGINSERPTAETLAAYKRAKIMAYVDPDAARELGALKDRSVAALDGAWKKAVLRNPKLAEIEADAELREVGPGKHALYSPTVAKMFQDAGVTFLEHDTNKGIEPVTQALIHDPKGGLLSSRERYQRGLFFEGQSTGRDFETGGADSAFTRIRTKSGSEKNSQFVFEVDPSELGRLDAYFFNYDNYGRAGKPDASSRKTVAEIAHTIRAGNLDSYNELMLQRQVPRESIRRVVAASKSDRNQLLERFEKAGIREVNGIPIQDFVVSR